MITFMGVPVVGSSFTNLREHLQSLVEEFIQSSCKCDDFVDRKNEFIYYMCRSPKVSFLAQTRESFHPHYCRCHCGEESKQYSSGKQDISLQTKFLNTVLA